MTKRVLIAESVNTRVLAEYADKGVEFVYKPDLTQEELEIEIKGFDGLIVRPKPVSTTAIQNADKLKLIIRGGAGVNSIALDECKNKGVIVENTPGLNSDATAEFTIQLMLQLLTKRQIDLAATRIIKGNPGAPEDYMGYELRGKKLGLIGTGNIALRVAKIAAAFGMEVLLHSRKTQMSLHELLASNCDVISLHIPLTPETENIISEREFALMKPTTILINTARPQLIDINALKSAQIAGFAIDGDYDLVAPFTKIKNGIITHHIADSTYEAHANITRAVLTQAVEFFMNGNVINRVL